MSTDGLAWWAGPGQDLGQALGRVSHHPDLPRAVAALAGAMLTISGDDRALDSLFKDAGRYAGAMGAFLLHETEGLTLPRLKALGARTGMLSPGRARLLLHMLEHLGFASADGRVGRAKRYAFTDRFLAAWVRHLRAALGAAGAIEPAVGALLDQPDEALRAFGRLHAGRLLATTTVQADAGAFLPLLQIFLHSYAGSHILWALLTTSQDGAFPPVSAGPITVSGLARRFDVSRIHVRRTFDEAERAGLATLGADGMVRFSVEAQEQLRYVWAIQLVHILMAAAVAAEERGLLAADCAAA